MDGQDKGQMKNFLPGRYMWISKGSLQGVRGGGGRKGRYCLKKEGGAYSISWTREGLHPEGLFGGLLYRATLWMGWYFSLPLPFPLLRSRSWVRPLNSSFLVSVGPSPKQGGLKEWGLEKAWNSPRSAEVGKPSLLGLCLRTKPRNTLQY